MCFGKSAVRRHLEHIRYLKEIYWLWHPLHSIPAQMWKECVGAKRRGHSGHQHCQQSGMRSCSFTCHTGFRASVDNPFQQQWWWQFCTPASYFRHKSAKSSYSAQWTRTGHVHLHGKKYRRSRLKRRLGQRLECAPVTFVSGDTNGNKLLDLNETWTYDCLKTVSQTETNTATAHGWASGWDGYSTANATVVVGVSSTPPLIHLIKKPSVCPSRRWRSGYLHIHRNQSRHGAAFRCQHYR